MRWRRLHRTTTRAPTASSTTGQPCATVAGTIPDRKVIESQTATEDISGSFSDPDGDALSYAAATSNPSVERRVRPPFRPG